MISRRSLLLSLSAAPLVLLAAPARSEGAVKLIVGASPGGTTDRVARGLGTELAKILDRTVIVENKAGAGGNIAAEIVSKAAPDGATFLICYTSFTINQSLYKKLPFDPAKDFTPISILAEVPSILVARSDFPASSVGEFIDTIKATPDKYAFAIGGVGSSLQLATAAFLRDAGLKAKMIPYKGTSPALADVLGGHADAMFASAVNVLPYLGTGKLKFIGVTSTEPMQQFPSVAPVSDTLAGFSSKAWFGILGPAGMSKDLLAKVHDAVVKAAGSDAFRKLFEPEGGTVTTMTPPDFAAFLKENADYYAKVVPLTEAKAG